ncbi:type III secretion system export apparatus subunit SctR [Burkholderia pyrrocinia]|uniref:type III secretion system export apparatus subunit SctR n=1 Tax=Burkholderia pyrrocinia TaxID=60550 RepID=UPI0010493167|nr:type III secretion system export apparatus subunit SctR [Burkholderia pyrrocinia]TDA48276.1 EscR/YscR/HrcR family type III secretion system export apparatus protein [Burkholderia pyrrocinia]
MNGLIDQAPDLILLSLALGIVPLACVLATSYTKIAIVFALLKNAIGIQQVPSMLMTNALALVITAYVMAPVALDAAHHLKEPAPRSISRGEWLMRSVAVPLGKFMKKHVDPREQERLLETSKRIWPKDVQAQTGKDDLFILLPAFAISEISAAFKIGFVLYLAFVAVDLIVANVLMAMGMIMFSPTVVSIPLKLILFVAVDGWSRLIQSLILTYQ